MLPKQISTLILPDLTVGGEDFGVITVGAAGSLATTEFKLVFSSNGDFFGRLEVALELVCLCWLLGCWCLGLLCFSSDNDNSFVPSITDAKLDNIVFLLFVWFITLEDDDGGDGAIVVDTIIDSDVALWGAVAWFNLIVPGWAIPGVFWWGRWFCVSFDILL